MPTSPRTRPIEADHKALIFAASMIAKTFLMATVATQVFCGNVNPGTLFTCGPDAAYVGGSAAAIALMGIVFGRYVVRIKSFNKVFANMMKADLIVTGMYLAVAFTAPQLVATRVMIWLFGTWIFGMMLAPFNSERTTLKKITEYGSIAGLGAFFALHFVPGFAELQNAYTAGMIGTSILSVFGGGRVK
ncbi:hypothetical protein [Nitrososphaera sp.]|uniref:hypothetical protein n=1 Tax=Nitrososphaera sp. TaxID=1971748 RepID=UPI00307EBEAD